MMLGNSSVRGSIVGLRRRLNLRYQKLYSLTPLEEKEVHWLLSLQNKAGKEYSKHDKSLVGFEARNFALS
jgi:hypothetical protein